MLSDKEKQYADTYLAYYSGKIPNIPANKTKVNNFIFGSSDEQIALLKEFITDILLPRTQLNKSELQANLDKINDTITELQEYIAE